MDNQDIEQLHIHFEGEDDHEQEEYHEQEDEDHVADTEPEWDDSSDGDEDHCKATDSEPDIGQIISIYNIVKSEGANFGEEDGERYDPESRITFRKTTWDSATSRYNYTASFRYGSFRGTSSCLASADETTFSNFRCIERNGTVRRSLRIPLEIEFLRVMDDNGKPIVKFLMDLHWDHGRSWVEGYAKMESENRLLSIGEKEKLTREAPCEGPGGPDHLWESSY